MRPDVSWEICGRGGGKTTHLVEWVRGGHELDVYPGWSRVIVTPTADIAKWTRSHFNLARRQVFSFDDWRGSYGIGRSVEVALDNLDMMLPDLPGVIRRVTITGVVGNVSLEFESGGHPYG